MFTIPMTFRSADDFIAGRTRADIHATLASLTDEQLPKDVRADIIRAVDERTARKAAARTGSK